MKGVTQDRAGAPGGPDVHAAAAEWLAKLYSGGADDKDRAEFSAWLGASEDRAEAVRDLRRIWADLPTAIDLKDVRVSDRAATGAARPRGRRRLSGRPDGVQRRSAIGALAAAAAAICVVALPGVTQRQADPGEGSVWRVRYGTGPGETKAVTLPDGSRLTLDAETRLTGMFSKDARAVSLMSGGAFFEVAHDRTKPFIVHVGQSRVKVVGTKFEVGRRPDRARVSVVEGVVEVGQGAVATANARQVRLTPGLQVEVRPDGAIGAVEPVDTRDVAAWRSGRFVFRNTRLQDVVADVNRYRKVKIALQDRSLEDIPVTMAIRVDQSEALLTGLQSYRGLKVTRSPTAVTISR